MSQNHDFDEIDNLMFEYFSKNNYIPESTKKLYIMLLIIVRKISLII